MKNISFTLDGYRGIYDQKYIFVVVLSLLYPVMIISNTVLIYIIFVERVLHKPMYIFICNLACINLYGGSAMTPFILTKMMTEDYQITWFSCLMQIFSIFTYGSCDITNLTFMAYDRYISICYPLEYEKIVTPTKVILGVTVSWLLPFVRSAITISLTANLNICGQIIEKVYCDNFSVVNRFNMRHVPYTLRVILSLYVLILSPIINPIIYGIKTKKIKEVMIKKFVPRSN
ncbi:olfactory receptor 11A1-like [Myxocyprinus asiaticus]|uniref:olfactory receptor 11A1-like n=1 Tax=Myxocyprinus asiaticus TaxID=70543 RepID=UPI0022216372|nr:olfactory receptor 11A1-like [Myxocyprinus asiaticus]